MSIKIFFDQLAQQGFSNLNESELATALGLSFEDYRQQYPSTLTFLKLLAEDLDARAPLNDRDLRDLSLQEALFELLMIRIEALEPYRAGVSRLVNDLQDPRQMLCFLPQIMYALGPRLEDHFVLLLNYLTDRGMLPPHCDQIWIQKSRATALLVTYLLTLKDWAKDTTPDLAVTLASLDQHLDLLFTAYGGVFQDNYSS